MLSARSSASPPMQNAQITYSHVDRTGACISGGAFPVKHDFEQTIVPPRFVVHELQRLRRVAYPRAWFPISRRPSRLRFKVARFEPLPDLRRNHDPGCVRCQALVSVRGRRSGRQRYAWSKTIPECQSEGRARPQQGGSANKTHNAHHREPRPGEGTPVDRHLQARLFPPLLADCRWDAAAPIPSEAPSPPCA